MTEGAQPQEAQGGPCPAPGYETGPGQKENPELSAKLQQKAQEKAEIQAEGLSIAQRLTRRAKSETIKIPFKDDLGEFFIEVRLPTSAEMDELLNFEKAVGAAQASKDPEAQAEAGAKLYKMLADLAVDPSLDEEFFKGGGFLASDLSQIIKEIFLEEEKRIKKVSSFRQDPVRARTL